MRSCGVDWKMAMVLVAAAGAAARSASGQEARGSPVDADVAEIVSRGRSFLGPLDRLDGIRTLDVLAECDGPSGRFTTRVQSHHDGDLVFHQTYEYRDEDFLAGIRRGRAWQRGATSGVSDAGDDEISVRRSHEFVMILLDPQSRLSGAHYTGVGTFVGERVSTVAFVDETGNGIEIHYAVQDGRPVGLTVENPLDTGAPSIEVEYTGWSRLHGLRVPSRLTIVHGGEVWHYRFTGIEVDTLTAEDFEPRIAAAGWEIDRR